MGGMKGGVSEKENAAAAREQAVREGYKFIELKLAKPQYDGLMGCEVLFPFARTDFVSNMTTYTFAVKGGPLFFERDASRNGRFHQLVDTELNRKALRGLAEKGIVEIVDKELEKEILSGAKAPAPLLSKEEYYAELNAGRVAQGLPPVGGESGSEEIAGQARNDSDTTPSVAPPKRKASLPPTVTGGSPLVSIAEE